MRPGVGLPLGHCGWLPPTPLIMYLSCGDRLSLLTWGCDIWATVERGRMFGSLCRLRGSDKKIAGWLEGCMNKYKPIGGCLVTRYVVLNEGL